MARIERISEQHVYVAFDPDGEIASTDFSVEFCFIDLDVSGNPIGLEAVGPVAVAITEHLAEAVKEAVGHTPAILERALQPA